MTVLDYLHEPVNGGTGVLFTLIIVIVAHIMIMVAHSAVTGWDSQPISFLSLCSTQIHRIEELILLFFLLLLLWVILLGWIIIETLLKFLLTILSSVVVIFVIQCTLVHVLAELWLFRWVSFILWARVWLKFTVILWCEFCAFC